MTSRHAAGTTTVDHAAFHARRVQRKDKRTVVRRIGALVAAVGVLSGLIALRRTQPVQDLIPHNQIRVVLRQNDFLVDAAIETTRRSAHAWLARADQQIDVLAERLRAQVAAYAHGRR
jgi:hypothetical protein